LFKITTCVLLSLFLFFEKFSLWSVDTIVSGTALTTNARSVLYIYIYIYVYIYIYIYIYVYIYTYIHTYAYIYIGTPVMPYQKCSWFGALRCLIVWLWGGYD